MAKALVKYETIDSDSDPGHHGWSKIRGHPRTGKVRQTIRTSGHRLNLPLQESDDAAGIHWRSGRASTSPAYSPHAEPFGSLRSWAILNVTPDSFLRWRTIPFALMRRAASAARQMSADGCSHSGCWRRVDDGPEPAEVSVRQEEARSRRARRSRPSFERDHRLSLFPLIPARLL